MKLQRTTRNGQSHLKLADPRDDFQCETSIDLSGATVAVLGCGSVGGFAALALASAGVGELILADKDVLAKDNLRRHIGRHKDVGSAKVDSLASALHDRFPCVEVRRFDHCFLERADLLRKLLAQSELTLVAVDHEGPKYVINDMLWQLRIPAVFAGVYGGGWAAEIILVDPARNTPCYGCAANALGRYGIDSAGADAPPPYTWQPRQQTARTSDNPERADGGAPRVVSANAWMQADLTSILPASALAADLATAWLAAERGSQRKLDELCGGESSAWRLAIRQVPAWSLGPWRLEPVPVTGPKACPLRCGAAVEVAA